LVGKAHTWVGKAHTWVGKAHTWVGKAHTWWAKLILGWAKLVLGGQSSYLGGQSSPLVTFQDSNSFLGLNESSIIKKAKKSGCGSKDRLTCKFDKENEVEVERLTDGLCSVF